MPFEIEATKVNSSFEYQGTRQEAQNELLNVKKWINPSGELKAGTLQLVKNWDGSFALKRRAYYYEFWKWGFRDTGRAELFVNSLIEKANSEEDGLLASPKESQEKQIGLRAKLSSLANYLTPNFEKIGTKGLQGTLPLTFLPQALQESLKVGQNGKIPHTPLTTESFYLDKDQGAQDCYSQEKIERILSSSTGIKLSQEIGAGGCARVYLTSVNGGKDNYVIKIEDNLQRKPIKEAGKLLHQRGDFSASTAKRLCTEKKQLSRIIAPAFVILALRKSKDDAIEYHFISAMAAESFANAVAEKYPHAQVATACQLMERAEGNELWDSVCGNESKRIQEVDFSPSNQPFKEVMNQVFENAEMMTDLGYLNGDLKAENVMYDPKTHKIKMIDHGTAMLLAKGETVKQGFGTVGYRSPDKISGKAHNQREDFYARAMIFLFMIDPVSCECMTYKQYKSGAYDPFAERMNREGKQSSEYLECYLAEAKSKNPHAKVVQELTKPENDAIKNLISLSFQASQLGGEGEKAYQQWKEAFHAWQQTEGFFAATS